MVTQPAAPPSKKAMLTNEIAFKERLLAQYDPAPDIASMESAADQMATLSRRRSQIVRELLPATQQEIDATEALVLLEVAGRVDDKGKPLGSNAESRKALLETALRGNAEYQGLLAQRIELQIEADGLDAEIDLAHRRYAAAKYAVEFKLGSVRVLGL